MNSTMIAIFVCILLLTVQSLMASDYLRHVQSENPQKYRELEPDREAFWNHLQPLRIAARYIVPGAYNNWGRGAVARRSALRLRIISVAALLRVVIAAGIAVAEYT